MLKDKPKFKRAMEQCQGKIAKADGPDLEEQLIVLTEIIMEHFAPSVPTLIKLGVYFLNDTEEPTNPTKQSSTRSRTLAPRPLRLYQG
jgi:hypothetical protein